MRTYGSLLQLRRCMLILLCAALGACSSQSVKPSDTSGDNAPSAEELPPKKLKVSSSHGEQEIMPTVVAYDDPSSKTQNTDATADFHDPLEFLNRPIFIFNDIVYRYFLIPVSHGYRMIMPDPFETGVSQFFANIREPINGLNNLFQGEFAAAGNNLSRLLINTTLGLAGFFDPATDWFGIDKKVAHVDDTLRHYDVGYGSFLVLPFIGQSDLRNGFSLLTESLASPVRQLTDNPETIYIQVYNGYQRAVPRLIAYEELRKDKADPYVFFRNLYMQGLLRDKQFPQHETAAQSAMDESEAASAPDRTNPHKEED